MPSYEPGFDVYGKAYRAEDDLVSALVQCFNEINSQPAPDHPGVKPVSGRFTCKRQGDKLMIGYHMMELDLDEPRRREEFVNDCHKAIATMASKLKSAFKKKTKTALGLKEDKGGSGWNCEQVSLNRQHHLRVWRVYSVSPEATQED